jgi:hypothetical protein
MAEWHEVDGQLDHAAVGSFLRHLLGGGSPNGTPPEAFGPYRDVIEPLLLGYSHGGTPKVQALWADLVRRRPELAEVVAADQSPSDPWQIFTLADAYQPRPPLIYIVDGLFPLPSLSIVYGAPGTIKSLLMADLAVCTAAGLPWLPPLPHGSGRAKAVHQVGVLWVNFDNGPRMTHERLEALGRARDLPPDIPLHYASMPSPWLDADNSVAIVQLQERISRLSVQLVVLDNLTTVKGSAEENSAAMGRVMGHFRQLAEATGAAVILIHHQRKVTHQGKGEESNVRAGDCLRGHSSIEAAVDLALLVERQPHADAVTLQGTKVRGVGVPPFGAQFSYEHRPGTTELATAKFFGMGVDDQVSDRAVETATLDAVKASPRMNQTDLLKEVKGGLSQIGINRIRTIIEKLEHQGKLHVTVGEHGAKLYELGRKAGGRA